MIVAVTHPSIMADADEISLAGFTEAITITAWAPGVGIAPSGGSFVVRLQDIAGASPTNFIEATITAGNYVGTVATGSVPIAAGANPIVRVVTASGAQFLRGHYETGLAAGSSALDLCTVAQVKVRMNPAPGAGEDAALASIISGVSRRMQSKMQRIIPQATYTAEAHSGDGWSRTLAVEQYPIIGTPTVTISDDAVVAGDLKFDIAAGLVKYVPGAFPHGLDNVEVTYSAGYATTPEDLNDAAIQQVIYEYKQQRKGDRIGEVSSVTEGGGTNAYLTQPWHPQTKETLRLWAARSV